MLQDLRRVAHRVLGSHVTWWALMVLYTGVVLVLLAPVLLSPIGGDDSYWVLDKGPGTDGSLRQLFWNPLSVAFDFDFQPRTTALALSERAVLAFLTMKTAVYFSIPPFLVWAAVKLTLFALSALAAVVLVRELRFRGRSGVVRGVSRESIALIAIALPLTIAIGVKAQNVNNLNGWNLYPTLAYGPFPFCLLFAALVLRSSRLLGRSYRRWVVPVVLLMMLMGVAVNLSYELLALSIPLNLLLLVLDPRPTEGSPWQRWRAPLTVGTALAVTYTGLFVWIRWQISQMACHATDTCYAGTVVEVRPRTLRNNLLGSLPGGTSDFVHERALARDLPYPGVTPSSIFLGVLAAALMLALWSSWRVRNLRGDETSDRSGDDDRGLLIVAGVGAIITLGASVISGINANAVRQLETSMLSYRTNVVTWSALALLGLAVVLMTRRRQLLHIGAICALAALIVSTVALSQPRNAFSVRDDRTSSRVLFYEGIQREVALGDPSRAGDARRCTIVTTMVDQLDVVDPRTRRTINGAYMAFEFYHHRSFCSTGAGDPETQP